MHSNAVNFEYIYPQMLYSKSFARTIQNKSHELFLMSKFLNYVRGKYDHEIVEKKIHILQMYLIYFEKQNKFNVYTFHKVEIYL